MAGRSFHSRPGKSQLYSRSASETHNSSLIGEDDLNGGVGDNDRNVLVQHDQLQMQNPVRPSSINTNNGNIHHDVSPSLSTPSESSTDLPNTVGNTARRDNGSLLYEEVLEEFPSEFQQHHSQQRRQQWESNYKEAAIFLEEGTNNDKFSHHPRSFDHLPAYLLVHNKWFNALDLGAALVLLCLGFVEEPCLGKLQVPVQVHGAIELCALVLIGVQVALKTRWIGLRTFMRHKRTAIKVLTLAIMTLEALVVLVNSRNHFRITRSLRPIFLIDNYFCGGVRRFVRQILQSLPPILDMLALVFFVMLIYSVFGFYFFGDIDLENFQTLSKSFVSLFVLLTTANYPDVMMKSYSFSPWSSAFFISYLAVNLYFLMNLMLAVVYDAFTRIEKDKFRRLYLHKRKAAQHAFKLLVTQERPDEVSFQHFEGLLTFYRPRTTPTEAYLMFKLLNKTNTGYLNTEEFYDVYDACQYSWNIGRPMTEWYNDMRPSVRRCLALLHKLVTSSWFEYTICLAVLANGVILIIQTSLMSSPKDDSSSIYSPWVSYAFVALYTVEASIKLLGLGSYQYFSSYWNTFDFCVTLLGILALIFEFIDIPLSYIIILRPLRLLTLFRMKRRFRDVFGTAVILMPRLISALIVLLLTYYFFAIIGMEFFGHMDLTDCCKNTSMEQYYRSGNETGYYYLNNFRSLPISGVTLFELTVVNNWFIIMDGYAIASGTELSRAFFMVFYVFTMIVMTIIVAFILEAFLFRIQFKEFLTKQDEIKKLSAEIALNTEELKMLLQRNHDDQPVGAADSARLERGCGPIGTYKFVGHKSRTKEQLQSLMYCDEMEQWLAEERLEEARSQARLMASLIRDGSENGMQQSGSGDQNQFEPSSMVSNSGEIVQVVEDEDEVTTIRRPILPDLMRP